MTVTVTPSNGSNFTWATAPWSWASANALVTWATSYPVSYAAQVTETATFAEGIGAGFAQNIAEIVATFSDAEANSVGKALVEALATLDALVNISGTGYFQQASESLSFTEGNAFTLQQSILELLALIEVLDDQANYHMSAIETLATQESLNFDYTQPTVEAISLAESWGGDYGLNQSEATAIAEGGWRDYGLVPFEAVAVAELERKDLSSSLAEPLLISELAASSFAQAIGETIATLDDARKDVGLTLADSLMALDSIYNLFSIGFIQQAFESLSVAEGTASAFGQSLAELLTLVEILDDQTNYHLSAIEALALSEGTNAGYAQSILDQVAMSDSSWQQFSQALSETLLLSELDAKGINSSLVEALNTSDIHGAGFGSNIGEGFGTTDTTASDISQALAELVAVAELVSRAATFYIVLGESLALQDANPNAVSQSVGEALHVIDAYVRKANAVFSNIVIRNEALDQAHFDTVAGGDKMIGYEKFGEFTPGNYQYQYAAFRAVLTSVNGDRARLSQLKVSVDVPDVYDRGSVVITTGQASAGVRINFARTFHVPPEITMSLKGGTVIAIPNIVGSVDVLGFTLILKDPATNNGVAGTSTWAAHGY